LLLVTACGAPMQMPPNPTVDAGNEEPQWSCPTCKSPIGTLCLGGCVELKGEQTYCATEFHGSLGTCTIECFADSECSSEHVGAAGWACCTGVIDARPAVVHPGHCIPPQWTCGGNQLFTT